MSGSKWVASNNEFIRDAIKKKKKNTDTHKKTNLFSWIWEEIDAFRNYECHTRWSNNPARIQKCFPCSIMFTLSPTVWPTQDDCVRLHASQSTCLNTGKNYNNNKINRDKWEMTKPVAINKIVTMAMACITCVRLQPTTYMDDRPSTVLRATKTSTKPLTFSSSIIRFMFCFVSVALFNFFVNSPFTTDTHTVNPLPAFNCDANANNLRYFGKFSSVGFTKIMICGRQFFVCGGPSSKRSNE